MTIEVNDPHGRGEGSRRRAVAAIAAITTIAVVAGACGSETSAASPDCSFDTSGVEPLSLEQNIPYSFGGRNYVAGNIGAAEVDGGAESRAVEMVESGPGIELTKTDVPDCGTYELAGVPVRIRVLDTSIEAWPTDGNQIYSGFGEAGGEE